MHIWKLRDALAELGIRPGAVSIDGLDATDNQYRLEKKDGFWTVYYFERGGIAGARKFLHEEDASSYLLDLLKSDPTTRIAR
jgi:hypothetical protein